MCQAKVYLDVPRDENLIMEDVAHILREAGNDAHAEVLVLVNLFGEEKRVEGRIASIDLLRHYVIIEREEP
ncbi:MAG: CooT family nickel-binding protein [Anaerolineae bacterium]